MSRYLSKRFSDMRPYVPGEQPQGRAYIKLNTNESPFPPASGVMKAICREEVEKLNLYPDPEAAIATEAIATYFGLKKENILLGNGSDEILAFCFQAYCDSDTPAVFADITYGFYKVFARIYGIPTKILPLDEKLQIQPDAYENAGGAIFIANPNAPTGWALPVEAIEGIVRINPQSMIIVDEAYAAFGAESAISLLSKYENLVVVHTMSKSRNLAGARLGYALANRGAIEDLNKMKFSFNPYNVNRLSLLAATAAMEDEAYFQRCISRIQETRENTKKAMEDRRFFAIPSKANFLFIRPSGIGAEAYYQRLKEKGILVRYFSEPRISQFVRITIGTEEQMQKLISSTDEIMGEV